MQRSATRGYGQPRRAYPSAAVTGSFAASAGRLVIAATLAAGTTTGTTALAPGHSRRRKDAESPLGKRAFALGGLP